MSAACLRRCVAALADGLAPEADDAVWLATGLRAVLDSGDAIPALGLYPGWRTAEQQRQRDDAIVRLADLLAPDGSARSRAAEVEKALRRYEAGVWQRLDCFATEPPTGRGETDRLLFEILHTTRPKANGSRTLKIRQLVEIVGRKCAVVSIATARETALASPHEIDERATDDAA